MVLPDYLVFHFLLLLLVHMLIVSLYYGHDITIEV